MIQTPSELDCFLEKIANDQYLAIDTEFKRVSTFYPELCLIQIATATQIDCIDVLAIKNLSGLFAKLYDPQTHWVVHSARQDIEALYYLSEQLPTQLFDTQLAASLLGMSHQISYQALTIDLQDVHLEKAYTRLDWTTRPLPAGAIDYALDDVRYLLESQQQLQKRLIQENKLDWLIEDGQKLLASDLYQPNFAEAWKKVKGVNRINKKAQNRAIQLAAWRESQAIAQDKPRRWVMDDETLLNYALQKSQLSTAAKAQFDSFIEQHAELANIDKPLVKTKPPTASEKAEKNKLQKLIQQKADAYNLDSSMIANGKSLLKYIRGDHSVEFTQGWRGELLRGELKNAK